MANVHDEVLDARLIALSLSGYTMARMAARCGVGHKLVIARCRALREAGLMTRRRLGRGPARVSPYSDPDHKKPEPDVLHKPTTRKCLNCRKAFASVWPGNRICERCKGLAEWRAG